MTALPGKEVAIMKSFRMAVYKPVNIEGVEGIYTEDVINDKLPDGFYKYYLVLNDEQVNVLSQEPKEYSATIITKKPVSLTGESQTFADIINFEDKKFIFDEFFKGYYRPIDFQIKAAEDKRNQQIKAKSRDKSKDIGRDDL